MISSFVALNEAVTDNFDLFYGVALSGYAFGTTLIPMLAGYLQLVYGWRGAMMILGAVAANMIPCAIAVRPPNQGRTADEETRKLIDDRLAHGSKSERGERTSSREKESSLRRNEYAWLLDPCMVLFLIVNMLVGFSFAGWQTIFVPRAAQKGRTLTQVGWMNLAEAVANLVIRSTVGICARKATSTVNTFITLTFIDIVSKLVDVFVSDFAIMLTCAVFSGLATNGMTVLALILGKELIDKSNFAVLVGIAEFLFGIGTMAGGIVSGRPIICFYLASYLKFTLVLKSFILTGILSFCLIINKLKSVIIQI